MDLQQEIQVSITVLITGLVVVFAMLVFLTLVIKGYGNAVHSLQERMNEMKNHRQELPEELRKPAPAPIAEPRKAQAVQPEPVSAAEPSVIFTEENAIPAEVLAAIAAAVYCMYPEGAGITAVRRSVPAAGVRSAWSMAGLLDNTRPF